MKTSIMALLVLTLVQPVIAVADGRSRGVYQASGTVVVGGGYAYGPRGGYRGGGWGYGGSGVGVYVGPPMFWGWPWGPPAYYPPPVMYPPVIAVQPPVVYVERGDTAAPAASAGEQMLEPGYWYYCRELAGYYPAVMQCPGLWVKVAPRAD
ncbi:hypothetical protein [Accumulibacter sp.]|uniref:hypothetical protein n=1 Tax=Accumulibacter sp. TaxID=2053492 RepID=UPI0028C4D728|nr:hypothetical protein [Accumulibacter sp.]